MSRRSTLYLLDRLDRQPETIDQLFSVSEYQQVMDSRNSFDSRSTEDRHKLDVNLGYAFDEKSYGKIWTLLNGNVSVRSQHLD